ncbi:major capsid protein [Leucobacter sp. NPDC058333]|uniref:major capsid protein n=1 Tax=Leucobacter sp. NPDC058333 TaxID=3346450 RepID=UPI00364D58A0
MAFTKSHRTAAQLTGIAQGTIDGVFGASIVSTFLPQKENQGLTFDFNVGNTSLPEAARFRSYNTQSDVGSFEGSESRQGKLPPISRRLHVDEFAQITQIGGDLGPVFEAYARRIAAQIATRFVWGGAEAIESGKLTIDERGLKFTIDYGRKAGLTATAPTLWSNPAADVIGDLEALRAVYGSSPGSILIPELVLQHLTRNEGIIELATRGLGSPTRISLDDVLSTLRSFGFDGLFTNRERFVDHTGTERTLFSTNKVIFLPAAEQTALGQAAGVGPLGTTDFGVTGESLVPENGLGGQPGAAAGALSSDDPVGFDVLVAAIGLPILQNANATASLQVL